MLFIFNCLLPPDGVVVLKCRSHKQLVDVIVGKLLAPRLAATEYVVVTLPAKKVR